MDAPEIQMPQAGRRRGRYSDQFKRHVRAACLEPGVSTAAVTLANGLNATIAADPKHLGAQIGATLVLHTWGSALTHHPHVHGIVHGGGLSLDGQRWVACKPWFFLPVRVLSWPGCFAGGFWRNWGRHTVPVSCRFLAITPT